MTSNELKIPVNISADVYNDGRPFLTLTIPDSPKKLVFFGDFTDYNPDPDLSSYSDVYTRSKFGSLRHNRVWGAGHQHVTCCKSCDNRV
jgi:hypothetical protein